MSPPPHLLTEVVHATAGVPVRVGGDAGRAARRGRAGEGTGPAGRYPESSLTLPQQFPQALRDLGYVENQNFILEWRSADGSPDRLARLAAERCQKRAD